MENYNLDKQLEKHVGEWVAVCEDKIVAHDKNPKKVMGEARSICGSKKRSIFRVHDKNQIMLL